MSTIDSRHFRSWCGNFATGVAVLTARGRDKNIAAITINSLTSVSLEPPLMLFCLERTAYVYPAFKKAKHFAINILGEGEEYLSRHFADPRHHAAPDNIWDNDRKGCPILKHTLGWMVCQRVKIHKAGDHDIIVGRTVEMHKNTTSPKPLLYFHGRYRKLGD